MIAHPVSAPVAPTDRVSDVLARDEALVEVFVRRSSHFEKLRSRTMRRVMARLVTVEQAARIAGIPSELLVRDLNDALGIAIVADAAGQPREPVPEASTSVARPLGAPEVELDVRPDLRNGREPFSRIMEAVAELEPGVALRLRAIFEPVPLYGVLAKRGFAHETRCDGDGDWSIWFWRHAAAYASPTPDVAAADAGYVSAANEIVLDVRGLEPPEPLMRTLALLETLPAGHDLIQINVRVPQFLIPMLGERGFVCEIDDSRADRVLVRIHRPR